jgi:hypothetical protein
MINVEICIFSHETSDISSVQGTKRLSWDVMEDEVGSLRDG